MGEWRTSGTASGYRPCAVLGEPAAAAACSRTGSRPTRTHGYAHPDEPLALKGDEYFLLNDNPLDFVDGRNSGPLHGADYLGVVEVIYWPPRRWGLVR